jgi:hypothetical protein
VLLACPGAGLAAQVGRRRLGERDRRHRLQPLLLLRCDRIDAVQAQPLAKLQRTIAGHLQRDVECGPDADFAPLAGGV